MKYPAERSVDVVTHRSLRLEPRAKTHAVVTRGLPTAEALHEGDGLVKWVLESRVERLPVEFPHVLLCPIEDLFRNVAESLSRQVELGFEQTPLRFVWRVVAIEVEPDLTESDGVVEQPA